MKLSQEQHLKLTKIYRMICSSYQIQKKDGEQLVNCFALGGYTISKSRAMNLLAGDESMTVEKLHAFTEGFFKKS